MNKKLTIILILLALIACAIISGLKEKSKVANLDMSTHLKKIASETKVVDAHLDHNQALDVAEYAKAKGIKLPSILVNFDTHSDIVINTNFFGKDKQRDINIESWINEIVSKNPEIKEIYWVMPDEEATSIFLKAPFAVDDLSNIQEPQVLYGNSTNKKLSMFHFFFNPLDKKAYEQELLLDTKTGKINENPNDEKLVKEWFNKTEKELKKIKLITCTTKSLPDFEGKKIFLSIDADYTSNSGFDTVNDFTFIKSENEIKETFYSIFKTLDEKNVKPVIISLSLSEQYLPQIRHQYVADIFTRIMITTNMPDAIETYTRQYEPPKDY